MATYLVSFKLTVVSRIAIEFYYLNRPTLEEIRETIKEVLDTKELKLQTYEDYEDDMRELAKKYGFKKKDLIDLVPELTHG